MDSTVLKVELDTTQATAAIDALTAKVEALQAQVDRLVRSLTVPATLDLTGYKTAKGRP